MEKYFNNKFERIIFNNEHEIDIVFDLANIVLGYLRKPVNNTELDTKELVNQVLNSSYLQLKEELISSKKDEKYLRMQLSLEKTNELSEINNELSFLRARNEILTEELNKKNIDLINTKTNRTKGLVGETLVLNVLKNVFQKAEIFDIGDNKTEPFDIKMTLDDLKIRLEVKNHTSLNKKELDKFEQDCIKLSKTDINTSMFLFVSAKSTIPTKGIFDIEIFEGTKIKFYISLKDLPEDVCEFVLKNAIMMGIKMINRLKNSSSKVAENSSKMNCISTVLSELFKSIQTTYSESMNGFCVILSQTSKTQKMLQDRLNSQLESIENLMRTQDLYLTDTSSVTDFIDWAGENAKSLFTRQETQTKLFSYYNEFCKNNNTEIIGISCAKDLITQLENVNGIVKSKTMSKLIKHDKI